MDSDKIAGIVIDALEDMKAQDVRRLEVRDMTSITDVMIVASGTSNRHVRSLAETVVEAAKKAGSRPLGVEGEQEGEWVLVDLGDLLCHIMLPRVRDFYNLEKLWDMSGKADRRRDAAGD